jgi:two-component system cell cycle sensor histidine kinase/response regulator CckA
MTNGKSREGWLCFASGIEVGKARDNQAYTVWKQKMESEAKILQAIFDHAALGIAQISLDGSWLRVNDRYCQMLGYSESELRTRKIWDITRPADYDEVSMGRRQLLEGAISSHSMEKRFVRKDGTIFWGRLNRSLVRDHDNVPQYFIAVVEDITERINAERALRDSEQRLTLAQNAAHLGVCEWDVRTNGLAYSGEYARLHGLAPDHPPLKVEELLQRTHPDDRERVQASVRNALERTHTWDTEYRVLWPDGSVHWLHSKGAVFADAAGRPVRSTGVILDITESKRAEAVLRESEERFRVTFFQAAVGIAQTGPDGQWLLINDRFCEMLGYSQTELRGKNFLDLTHPDDREASLTALRRLLAGEISSWLKKEKRYIRKGGGTVWVRLFISLVRDQHNQPQYFISVLEDITEQKLIEERLRASEARLREAQHLAKVGSWERHIKSDTIHWSEEMFRILGLPNGAPANFLTFLSYVHPKDREKILEIDAKVRSSIAPVEAEYRIIRPDGETRFVRSIVQGISDDQGVPIRIAGATQDITERVKARERQRESEGYLRNAAHLAHVGYWQWDIQANHVSGSEEMYRIFGKPPDHTPSYDDFLRTVIPQDKERVARWVSDCLAEKRGSEVEYQIVWPDGDLRTVSCITEVSVGEDGSPTRMFGACQDITDFRRAQRENLARQKLESIGTLAGGIAHDFNNLLAGVLAEAELAATELEQGESPLEGLRRIRLAAGRGAEIVRELMTYSGQDKAGPVEPVDLSQLVEEILGLLKISVSKHAVLKVDLQKKLPAVSGNSARLRQVVMNLVINASEAIGERDGLISVTTSHIVLPRSSGPDLPPGDYLNLEISDTGCGMTEEVQAKVFDPFFSTKFAGRGLGLAVVQGIVRDHGGAIHLVSAPGQGTKFEILLPSAGERAQSTRNAIVEASGKDHLPRVGTILLVEDESVLRVAVSKMLRKNGFGVIEAGDGSCALDLVRGYKDEIDLMLLDITLPGVSSREVLEQAHHLRPNLKVILTSAYGREAVDASFAGLRVEHFIRKPFQFVDLMGLLRDALSG